MSADILMGDSEAVRLIPHPLRAAVLGEVHARPSVEGLSVAGPVRRIRKRHIAGEDR